RGKRRIHKSPSQREAAACAHWLEDEIALIRPRAIVALGARASWSLTGKAVAVTAMRGQWMVRTDGLPVLITLHPSGLLRLRGEAERAAGVQSLIDDLTVACAGYPQVP
ncbi:MAG: uracil-DNA glycosylase family protein, partial [Steroidobacteraceae bacterium]